MKRWILFLLASVAACVEEPPPLQLETPEGLLSKALSSGSQVVHQGGGGRQEPQARVIPRKTGWVAVMNTYPDGAIFDDATRQVAVARVAEDGSMKSAVVRAARTRPVSLGDEVLLASCGDRLRFYLSDPGAGAVELQASGLAVACSGALGAGATPDTVVSHEGSGFARWTLDRSAGTVRVDALPELAPEGTVLFVDEPASGELALVSRNGSFVTYQRAGKSRQAAVGSGDGLSVWRGADGALRLADLAALRRWNVDADEDPALLAEAPAPLEGSSWKAFSGPGGAISVQSTVNPGSPEDIIPTRWLVRWASDGGWLTAEPSLTPCCDAMACRDAGESYLIGAYGEGPTRQLLWDLWSWYSRDQHALIVSKDPLSCP